MAEYHELHHAFFHFVREYTGISYMQAAKFGSHPGQMYMIECLYHHDGVIQNDLAKMLKIKPATVAVSLKRLEKNGIIMRKSCEDDKRAQRVYLTEEGRKIRKQMKSVMTKIDDAVFGTLSESDQEKMISLLTALSKNVEKMKGEQSLC